MEGEVSQLDGQCCEEKNKAADDPKTRYPSKKIRVVHILFHSWTSKYCLVCTGGERGG